MKYLALTAPRLCHWIVKHLKTQLRIATRRYIKHAGKPQEDSGQRIIEFHQHLENRYRPKPYCEAIILLCFSMRDNFSSWRKVVGSNLEIVQLPIQPSNYDNPHLVDEPFAKSLANALLKFLNDNTHKNENQ